MKNIKLKILDDMNNLIKEQTLTLSDGTKLIVKYPYGKYTIEKLHRMVQSLDALLNGNVEYI